VPEVFALQFMAHIFPHARIMLFHCAAMMSRTINSSLPCAALTGQLVNSQKNCSDVALHYAASATAFNRFSATR